MFNKGVEPAGKIKHNTIYSENDTNNVSDVGRVEPTMISRKLHYLIYQRKFKMYFKKLY